MTNCFQLILFYLQLYKLHLLNAFVYFLFLKRDNPYDPSSGEKGQDNVPPATDPMCREQNALQGRMTQPTNLPMKDVNRHYLTCMDSRVGYAAISAPGGDMGQFILGLGK